VESDKKEPAMTEIHRCLECGAELAPDVAQGLCPKCLLKAGLGARTDAGDAPTVTSPAAGASPVRPHAAPEVGQSFGPYRLVRLLGKGGMGAVYEAEHLESGRRVALKVLSHSLDSPEARGRFLREGRLAASINHPNSVYIYGTEEVEGTPAIAMELVPGGTLEDRVRQKGPMPVAEAVDAILQIVEGLEAAQAVGVLHRDVKPSNCFVEAGGTVKVGDFGLSISTKAREEIDLTVTGTFLGTPAFASPEQLRGDELDVRSDIYGVGVTLYYLLTGKTPFRADNLIRFIATALEQPAASPATFRREIPKGLCRAVLRCLEKQPAQRFKNYSELRHALLPFASAAPTPATLGLRFLAHCIDMLAWSVVWAPVMFTFISDFSNPAAFRSPVVALMALGGFALLILYYGLTEGLWGASLGKAICRLRVVGPGRSVPGVPKALLRATVFLILPVLPTWIYFGANMGEAMARGTHPAPLDWVFLYSYYVMLAVLFATARRRNGFAGLHDLASGTRVIRKAAYEARPVFQAEGQPLPVAEATPTVGPYYVLDRLDAAGPEELVVGYDARLLRKVWIRRVPEGTPPVAPDIRNAARAGRLRWLGGKRAAGENWDAYEAAPGKPLLALLGQPQPWRAVRYWLLDLAEELAAGLKDGSVPAGLGLDRVWITADGRAKLLDVPAPGIDPKVAAWGTHPGQPGWVPPGPGTATCRAGCPAVTDFPAARLLLNQVGIAALEGRMIHADAAQSRTVAVPVPLHARAFLSELATLRDFDALTSGLKPLLQRVASVTRARRLGLAIGCGLVPALMVLLTMVGLYMFAQWAQREPDIQPLSLCLWRLAALEKPRGERQARERQALEVYIAGRFRQTISDPATWSSLYAQSMIPQHLRTRAEQVVAERPSPSEQELKEAEALVAPMLVVPWLIRSPTSLAVFQASMFTLMVALASLVCALAFRGGLVMLLLGVAVVKRDGSRASRLRVFWRSLVTWSSLLLLLVGGVWLLSTVPPGEEGSLVPLAGSLGAAVLIALAVWSSLLPDRGLQDRLAGTWLVPR
jgi:hypothetical protein